MDDCNLDKLGIKPGKLSPLFKKDVLDYSVTLGSTIEKITFDCLTSDTGASYCISGSDGGRTVPLKEGQVNDIKIEVSAEDGTTKIYLVHVHRLSAKDAKLSDLKVGPAKLRPEFNHDCLEYSCTLPCDLSCVKVSPSVADTKTTIAVDGNKTGSETVLNVGMTSVSIKVTSADGSNTQEYKLSVYKKQIPRHIKLNNSNLAAKYECPVSLGVLYQPITIKDSDPNNAYTGPIIDHLTKTSKVDPLSGSSLVLEWRVEDETLDKELSGAEACIKLSDGSCTENVKLSELGSLLKNCNKPAATEDVSVKYESKDQLKHTIETRPWEKQLQQIFDESDANKLCAAGRSSVDKYYESLPAQTGRRQTYADGESPLDHLDHAAHCYATAVKHKPRDAELHLRLGQVLEQRYYTEDVWGIKRDKDKFGSVGANSVAKESSKAEECAAICELRGASATSPLSLQLKAIDAEYHHLLDSGQSQRADHVQGLYAWKSKQATQAGAVAQKAADEESPLGQAYHKYLDALSLDDAKAVYHVHVGRLLVVRGDYDAAVPRLEAALSWNSKHNTARFYLGLALSLRKDGPGARVKEAVSYLAQAMETLLEANTQFALSADADRPRVSELHAEDLLSPSNVHLLRGILQLARLLQANSAASMGVMAADDVLHTAALLTSASLTTTHRGDTYQQLEWVLLDAHSQLLERLLATNRDNVALIASRCQRLSALIKYATIPHNADLLVLQEKTSQMLVEIQPCSSHALYLLGSAQLAQYDNDPAGTMAAQLLSDAQTSFRAGISLEGKAAEGGLPAEVREQKWWQDKVKAEEARKAAAANKSAPAATPAARGGARGAAAGRGGAAAARGRGAPARGGATATRGGASTGRGGATAGRGGATTTRGGARGGATAAKASPARGGTTAARGGAVKAPAKGAAATPGAKPAGSSHSCDTVKPGSAAKPGSATKRPGSAAKRPASAAKDIKSDPASQSSSGKPAVINKKSYQPRLGLARALSKTPDSVTDALKYYKEVIELAPEIHDAYIESADMIIKTDPLAAVDIYCKFPVSADLTFDDAYIFGEIVRLLMKAEKYDDPRLGPNMISLGRVMGLGCLEKHVTLLENKGRTELLKVVYAGVNRKEVDDPDLQAFFKFKMWI